jgi:uncharacterized protein with NAD-binding domain and iron-sulfur cluster
VLNGPTNERWLDPWHKYLTSKGVKYYLDASVKKLEVANGQISGAWVELFSEGRRVKVTGDYYVLAVPVEKADPLIDAEVLAADKTLQGIKEIAPYAAWMNGIQFFLSEKIEMVRGHCIYADAPWALTSISQLDFWVDYDIEKRGHGNVKTILSVDVSNWEQPADKWVIPGSNGELGGAKGKMASECTIGEIKEEIWYQLKQSLNVNGSVVLKDEMRITIYLDHDIHPVTGQHNKEGNYEPLLVNRANTWTYRPEAWTQIPNLFLASDYVRTYTDLATMEAANEAARRAVNCILDTIGSDLPKCEIWNLHEPDILAPLRHHDKARYNQGLPYKMHIPLALSLLAKIVKFILRLFGRKT